jgi:hypothetical protein
VDLHIQPLLPEPQDDLRERFLLGKGHVEILSGTSSGVPYRREVGMVDRHLEAVTRVGTGDGVIRRRIREGDPQVP